MNHMLRLTLTAVAVSLSLVGCGKQSAPVEPVNTEVAATELVAGAEQRLDIYHPVDLTADLSHLSDRQRHVVELLIEASEIMDELFWQQAYGASKASLLSRIDDDKVSRFADINYGPWDRLNNNKAF